MTSGGETADAARDVRAALLALSDALARLDRLVAVGKNRYDVEESVRLALQRLWIAAGECARRYSAAAAVDAGAEPWSSLWGYRNFLAHRLPSEIGDERVWAETMSDLPGYRAAVDEVLGNRRA